MNNLNNDNKGALTTQLIFFCDLLAEEKLMK